MNIQIIEMVVVNSICCLLSAIIDNTFYQLFVLVFSSAPKSGIAVAQYFYLLSLTSVLIRKPKQTMVDRQSDTVLQNFIQFFKMALFICLSNFESLNNDFQDLCIDSNDLIRDSHLSRFPNTKLNCTVPWGVSFPWRIAPPIRYRFSER